MKTLKNLRNNLQEIVGGTALTGAMLAILATGFFAQKQSEQKQVHSELNIQYVAGVKLTDIDYDSSWDVAEEMPLSYGARPILYFKKGYGLQQSPEGMEVRFEEKNFFEQEIFTSCQDYQ